MILIGLVIVIAVLMALGCGFDSVGLHVAGQGDQPAERAVAALSPVG